MAKFLVVKEKPEDLKKGEYVIDAPSFLDEIKQNKTKAPKNGLTGTYHLRVISDTIAQNYDPENMTGFSVKVHPYEGRPYSSDEELNTIVVEMLRESRPDIFLKYIDKKIRTRPFGTNLVYYVDSDVKGAYTLFYQHGLSDARDIETDSSKTKKPAAKSTTPKEQVEVPKQ